MADNLKKAGWSYGYVSAIDSNGRTTWIADAHRDDGKVRADEKLTAFLELEAAVCKPQGKLKSKAQKTDSYTESARFGVVLSAKRRA
jgi:hypothetical protein